MPQGTAEHPLGILRGGLTELATGTFAHPLRAQHPTMTERFAALARAIGDRYTLDRQIGEGGMATVYRAEDLKHHRAVAIKVLRPELAQTIGTERFLREIELAAKLQHPHIVPVYDSGAVDGILFYVMPYIEGESLRDRLTRSGALPLQEAIRLNREAASALQYAHQHGIVHRDIKPENIMLSGGHAVVADFGIARAAAPSGDATRLTGMGIAIGTPAYMSTEQATADEVDARSDQYSLACVFFEMATGRAAFTGKSVQALLASHITGPRPKLAQARDNVASADISDAIDAVVARALSPDRDQRYPDIMAFSDALEQAAQRGGGGLRLRWWMGVAAALIALVAGGGAWFLRGTTTGVKAGAERIAILPFSVTGGGDAAMAEGMVNLLTTNLGTVKEIQTVDPQTVFVNWRKRGGAAGVDLQGALSIARATKASAAMLGSITYAGSRTRLVATIYGLDGSELGQAQTEGASDSVLALVDDLSARLVREIWRSREPVPSLNVAGVTTGSLPALRAYLEGEQFYRRARWDSAQAAFTRAVQADSTFALAQYRLAMAYGWGGGYNNQIATKASIAAGRYSDKLPARLRTLVRAYRLFQDGNPAAADTMRAYLQQQPDDPDALYLLGESMFHSREIRPFPPESIQAPFERVLAIDSTLTPALIHPLELTLMYRDTVKYRRYFSLLRAAAEPDVVRTWAIAGQMMRERPEAVSDSALRIFLAGGGISTIGPLMLGNERMPDITPDELAAFSARASQIGPTTGARGLQEMPLIHGMTMIGLGRLTEARKQVDDLTKAKNQNAQFLAIVPAMSGLGTQKELDEFKTRMSEVARVKEPNNPFVAMMATTIALQAGDKAEAKRLLGPWLSRDTSKLDPQAKMVRPLFEAQAGWLKIIEGDTVGGLKEMDAGLNKLVNRFGWPFKDPLRMEYAVTLAHRPETRDRGIALLEYSSDSPLALPLSEFALGRIYEQNGRTQDAIDAYQTFTRLWSTADSSLQPRVQEAKDALARLTAEGKRPAL